MILLYMTNKKENPVIVCLIAFTGREDLIRCNIALLKQQTLPIKTLLVGSTAKDRKVAEECQVDYYLESANRPLGRKWQNGLSKILEVFPDVDAVLINGSDDFLSPHYAEIAYRYINPKGYDLVGKKDWYIYDGQLDSGYYMKKNIYSVLGAGRMWSRNILDQMEWNLFPKKSNNQLDALSYKRMTMFKGKYGIINNPCLVILSIKGKHIVISSTKAIVRDQSPLDRDSNRGTILKEIYNCYQNKDYLGVINGLLELEKAKN